MMKRRALFLCLVLVSTVFSAFANPTINEKNDKEQDSSKPWVAELKKSVQFNYGSPLPLKDLRKSRISTPKEDGLSYYNWIQKKYADKMQIDPSEVANTELYNFINEWYGVRYVYGGTTKGGVDCSSFVQKLMNAVYNSKMQRTAASQYVTTETLKREELSEGDLVFFKIKVPRISHVGVYLKNNFFVHASSSRGVMISNLNSSYWSRYFAGGGRVL